MDIAIIDADLIRRKNHRFPNLASMKLSSYYKNAGNNVILETNYDNLHSYDKILNLLFQNIIISLKNIYSFMDSIF